MAFGTKTASTASHRAIAPQGEPTSRAVRNSLLCAAGAFALLLIAFLFAGLLQHLPDGDWVNWIAMPLGMLTAFGPPALQIAGIIFAISGLRNSAARVGPAIGLSLNLLLLILSGVLLWVTFAT